MQVAAYVRFRHTRLGVQWCYDQQLQSKFFKQLQCVIGVAVVHLEAGARQGHPHRLARREVAQILRCRGLEMIDALEPVGSGEDATQVAPLWFWLRLPPENCEHEAVS